MRAACHDDASLGQLVLSMLEEDRRQQPLLDTDLSGLAETTLRGDHAEALVAQQIGPYRLLRLLGEGGSGVVYLAERSHLGGSVAIKLLRHAWMSPMRRDRFALEQRTLARLNHPGIARIYDAGTLDDGTPWFVMEFVDGQPLNEWLAVHGKELRETLQLFCRICEAVRYAHGLAIIHRDLKPSNILVTFGGDGKLLDFGIAKQLHTEGDTLRTVEGLRMMTPAYAAPEQQSGGDIGVFTDVYALGVILYEMLSGSLPVRLAKGGLPAAEAPFVPPSTLAVRGIFAETRSALPGRDWGDLDVLCLTALAAEPEHRYRTVDALLQDVEAYLEGRPLLARPPSWRRNALKFVRRNRTAVISAALGIATLIIASAVFTVRLAHARDEALSEAARVKRIQRFTESLFDGGDAEAGPSVDMKTSDLLKRGEAEAEGLRGDPRLQADMFTTLGTVYERMGSLPKADALLQRASDERRTSFGEQSSEYADSLLSLGLLRKDERRMEDAEKLLQQAVDRRRLLHDAAGLQQALVGLGSVLSLRGQYEPARALLEEAQRSEILAHATGTTLYAETLSELADIATYQAHYEQAEDLDRQALALDRQLYGELHPQTTNKLNSLANLASDRGQYQRAESLFRQAIAADTAWYGPEHPQVADDLTSLSQAYTMMKRFDEAEALLGRALLIEQRAYGEHHSRVAILWNQIGVLAYSRDQDDKAEQAFRKAMAIFSQLYGPTHQFVGLAYSNLMGVDIDRKEYAAAERNAHEALRIYALSLPADHMNNAVVHLKLGRALMHEGRNEEAAQESLTALRHFARHSEENPEYLDALQHDLARIAGQMSDKTEAAHILQTAQAIHPQKGSQ